MGWQLLELSSYVRSGLGITVSQKYKDKTKRTVDRWKQKMLERYPPSGILNELDLSRFTIVDKHLHWTSTRLPKAGMHAHIISTNDGERVQLLLLRNPTVWDAKDKTEMLDYRIEFTAFDREGVCVQTIIPDFIFASRCFGDNAIPVTTGDGHHYYIDLYHYLTRDITPHLYFLSKGPRVVVRNDDEIRWASETYFDYRLQFKNIRGDMVIYAEKISLWRRLFVPDNVGPRLKLTVEVADEVPPEVAVFLSSCTF